MKIWQVIAFISVVIFILIMDIIISNKNYVEGHSRNHHLFFTDNKLSILPKIELKKSIFLQNQPIVFIHVSKTGGSNIDYLTKALSVESGNFNVDSSYAPCEEGMSVSIVTKGCIGGLKNIEIHPERYNLDKKKDIQVVLGHMPLPTRDFFKTKVTYISMVRNPLDRLLSLGNYLYQRKFIEKNDIENLLLNIEIDNLQTRSLAGEEYMNGECTEETFNQAIKNIHEVFTMVAPIEEMDVAMALIANHFGVDDIAYSRAQISGVKFVTKDNKALCDEILKRNNYDVRLHNYVKNYWLFWKEDHIKSISNNVSDHKKYMILSHFLYGEGKIKFMNLEEIHKFGDKPEELIGVRQFYRAPKT